MVDPGKPSVDPGNAANGPSRQKQQKINLINAFNWQFSNLVNISPSALGPSFKILHLQRDQNGDTPKFEIKKGAKLG